MNHFLQEEKQGLTSTNSCTGYTSKSVTTNHGTVRVTCPGDRPGCSVPLIIPNNQTFRWFWRSDCGVVRSRHVDMGYPKFPLRTVRYEVKASLIFEVTDESMLSVTQCKIVPLIRCIPWSSLTPFASRIVMPAMRSYPKPCILFWGRDDGTKDILCLWLGDTESAAFWLNVFNELKLWGVQDILIAVSDGLSDVFSSLKRPFLARLIKLHREFSQDCSRYQIHLQSDKCQNGTE